MSELAEAWSHVLAALDEAGAAVERYAEDDLDRAEGYRFVTRLLSFATDMHVENADRRRPMFTRVMTPTRKFFGDNPDTYYDWAPLAGRLDYRIAGTVGTIDYLAFCFYGRDPDGGANRIVANVSDRDFTITADGHFEIFAGSERPAGVAESDWVQLAPDADAVVARQYFLDRANHEPAAFTIESLDGSGAPEPLSPTLAARRLHALADWVRDSATMSGVAAQFMASNPNAVSISSSGGDMGAEVAFYPTPDNRYAIGWFELESDEALVIEGHPPDARYWALQVLNRWMESLDYRHRTVTLNKAQVTLEQDGSFRFVLAHRDPGHPNWVDTEGHRTGYVGFRWMQADPPADPTFTVVKLADVMAAD